jgi:hypothetical protein
VWHDVTSTVLPETAAWTNRVALADIDGDGRVDLLFANGGNCSDLVTVNDGEIEKGVRIVQVYYAKGDPWADRFDILDHRRKAKDSVQPFAASSRI